MVVVYLRPARESHYTSCTKFIAKFRRFLSEQDPHRSSFTISFEQHNSSCHMVCGECDRTFSLADYSIGAQLYNTFLNSEDFMHNVGRV